MQFPQLETSRLQLTQLTRGDAADVLTLFSQSSVVKYYDLEQFTDEAQAKQLIAFFSKRYSEGVGIRWGIKLKETNTLIGTCGYNSWSAAMRNAVIGYDLHPNFWGKGIMTEALQAIIKVGFNGDLPCGKLHRIQADTVPGNIASEAVLTKLGFREEGIRRQAGFWKNAYHDLKCFALLASQLPATSLK
ncbi:GNAT family N-acetyltransferase [Thalassotalea ganghwensis]